MNHKKRKEEVVRNLRTLVSDCRATEKEYNKQLKWNRLRALCQYTQQYAVSVHARRIADKALKFLKNPSIAGEKFEEWRNWKATGFQNSLVGEVPTDNVFLAMREARRRVYEALTSVCW